MTHEDFRRVEAWLYNIPRVQIAIENLRHELERLDTKRNSPPTWMSNPDAVPVMGGELDSRQARWVEFLEEYPVRRAELLATITEREQQLKCFKQVLDILQAEDSRLAQLVRKKYIEKMRPDRAVWENVLFVSKPTYYRMRIYVVQAFFDCLPGYFLRKVS